MAFCDDEDFLVSHIRHCFVTSDDTGMCEMVIVNEEVETNKVRKRVKQLCNPNSADPHIFAHDSLDIASAPLSFDIAVSPEIRDKPSMNKPGKVGDVRKQEPKIKNVNWKDPQESLTTTEISNMFNKKPSSKKKRQLTSSQLSKQLEQTMREPDNPYLDYARFDGEAYQETCSTKKLRIFLTMVNEEDRNFPMFVTVLGTATVHELIGLIMFKYTVQNLQPPVYGTADRYCLQIAEDDGEVDTDFPALEKDERITKFDFKYLALVEICPKAPAKQPVNPPPSNAGVIVKVNDPHRGYSQVKVDSTKVKLKVVYDKMLKKRGLRRTGHEYVLEKESEPGVSLDLESPLSSMETLEFVLTKGNRNKLNPVERDVKFDLTSFQYMSYRVQMVHKLRTVTEIYLGVSIERIEIHPVDATKSSKLWLVKQKPVSYDMENIGDCEITEWKSVERASFRIWYYSSNSHEFKHHDFEADREVADDIVKKVKHIFKSTVSEKRREFLAAKEKKAERRKSYRS